MLSHFLFAYLLNYNKLQAGEQEEKKIVGPRVEFACPADCELTGSGKPPYDLQPLPLLI